MSVQFGRWNFDGTGIEPEYLDSVASVMAPYGPDEVRSFVGDGVCMLHGAFHTTRESHYETQPHRSASGRIYSWDGRLDNGMEITSEIGGAALHGSTDTEIVVAAYEQWGANSFAKLIGDWALAIWHPKQRSLILAKDFLGTRHLYYSIEKDHVVWSSVLDPIVLFGRSQHKLEEEYLAGSFTLFPATHLTPYVGVHSVPPSSFVAIEPTRKVLRKYWDFEPFKKIRYRSDAEYEEHFRTIFATAVKRRLRSDSPILAELSGGMDSSSIVCMADRILEQNPSHTPRLDTLSYFNASEPNWNELPYLTTVEQKRGRSGCHIDTDSNQAIVFRSSGESFAVTPAARITNSRSLNEFTACLETQKNRVVLSGIGGDESNGGVPTPIPRLADLVARARVFTLVRELMVWALHRKQPWWQLLFETTRPFLPLGVLGIPDHLQPPCWFDHEFVRRNRLAFHRYARRLRLLGPLPSFQENLSALDHLRRKLACTPLTHHPIYEKRYPFLDRSFLEFIYAVPREQLVRPGQRRSLMRRALVGIVPEEILNRRRKAYVVRSPMVAISKEHEVLAEMSKNMVSSSLGMVIAERFVEVLEQVQQGRDVAIVPLMRTIGIEQWLQYLSSRGMLEGSTLSVSSAAALSAIQTVRKGAVFVATERGGV